jgi:hypothetical protein
MTTKTKPEAQNPLILRCHRLMETFAKANDERDFYLDRMEGFILYVDLDKTQEELDALHTELQQDVVRYCQIPKLTFYETKKIMEGFVNEKVYDIDTKEKLLDIIQSKEARENFLEFIYDHHAEFEKWQQYYQERSRIRIIEWLRQNHFHFVFEEDLDLAKNVVEKLKLQLFQVKAGKEIVAARKNLIAKAKTYYSNEALNPRPKRGRPPKQAIKQEIEPQMTNDIYLTVTPGLRPFLFIPDYTTSSAFTFSAKFETEEDVITNRRIQQGGERAVSLDDFQTKLASLRTLSSHWLKDTPAPGAKVNGATKKTPSTLTFAESAANEPFDSVEAVPASRAKKAPAKDKKPVKKSAASSKTVKKPESKTSKGRPKGSTKKKRIIPHKEK